MLNMARQKSRSVAKAQSVIFSDEIPQAYRNHCTSGVADAAKVQVPDEILLKCQPQNLGSHSFHKVRFAKLKVCAKEPAPMLDAILVLVIM